MRTPVQKLILNFIRQNPDCQMSEIIAALTGLGRSSISSTLPKLVRQGRLIRTVGINQRYEYRIVVGKPLRLPGENVEAKHARKPPALVPQQKAIGMDEWQTRFQKVRELEAKGLHRRAARMSLELLDVTGDARLREKLIIFKGGDKRMGIWL